MSGGDPQEVGNLWGVRGLLVRDTLHYTNDGHGNIDTILDGENVREYHYDAYGNEISPDGDDANPYHYCSENFDAETGLYYLRNRYYDPELGRFLTEDPAKDGDNWFVYCGNNPITFVDPTGLAERFLRDIINERDDFSVLWNAETGIATAIGPGGKIDYCVRNGSVYKGLEYAGYIQDDKIVVDELDVISTLDNDGVKDDSWMILVGTVGATVAVKLGITLGSVALARKVLEESDNNLPPGWNENWQWRYPEGNSANTSPRWFDPNGGEWRWHAPDKWHNTGHWDYNPWTSWNSPWQNIYPPFN